MVQQKRGYKFALSKIKSLLEAINAIIPIGNLDWERAWNKHPSHYPTKDQTTELLERKFQKFVCAKIPTGDLNCPPHVPNAKHIHYKIVMETDRLTGGSEDGGDLDNERDGE
jgi:hypothetical protein